MPDRQKAEILFLEHLEWINRVAAMTCSKAGVQGADAEDFAGFIRMELMEDDYASIRKFRGESKLKTYLATVVVRRFHDYWRERRGRWRRSAVAERLGPPAGELETLVYRDGFRLDQAGEKLRTSGRTTLSDVELAHLLEKLPRRGPLRPREVETEVLEAAEAPERADAGIASAETRAVYVRLMGTLRSALEQLDPEERMIVLMHFGEGRTLAEVSRTLRLEQKPLYRRVERLRRRLRVYLEHHGVHGDDVRGILGEQDVSPRPE
jgi:RNA polymerase sigma factor (sigma-70 family)